MLISPQGFAEAPPADRQAVIFSYLGAPAYFLSTVTGFCRDATSGRVIACHLRKDVFGQYWIDRLPPGRYVLQVALDENRENPPHSPGDYERYFPFKVDAHSRGPLRVTLQKLIHMVAPADNNGAVEGNSAPCKDKPHFEVPLLTLHPEAKIQFAWEPLESKVTYHYTLWKAHCGRGGVERLLYKQTDQMQVTETLPPSAPGEYYLFRITAVKDGEMVGNFELRDNGGAGMRQYRFRVVDPIGNRQYLYIGFLLGLLYLLVIIRAKGQQLRPRNRPLVYAATRRKLVFTISIAVLMAGGYFGYDYYHQQVRDEAISASVAKRERRAATLRTDFEQSIPKPAWWGDIGNPGYLYNSHSDIVAMLPNINYGLDGLSSRRTIIKRCYLSIEAHADDDNLVTACLGLMASLAEERGLMLKSAQFGIRHYFTHEHTTDYCVGCRAGDATAELVIKAAIGYKMYGNNDRAIALINRFLKAREKETSPYMLTRLYTQLGTAYWESGQRAQAMAVLNTAQQRYDKSGANHNLQYYQKKFRAELGQAAG